MTAAFRPTVVFVAAFALNSTPHEAAHAVAAYVFGFHSTLFQMWVNPNLVGATAVERVIVALAGPLFSLAVGTLCWLIYRRCENRACGLVFLMLMITGVYIFLGNVFGAAFGGDIHVALGLLAVSPWLLYAASAIGFLTLGTFMFFSGAQLAGWAPSDFGRAKAVMCTVVAPWLVGTALSLLMYWPLPAFLLGPTVLGSAFWVFAVIGGALGFRRMRTRAVTSLTPLDGVVTASAVLMVRLLTNGISLT